ncbi:MAG: HXXEE domain-containing protein [Clostridium sp.]|nr:HXXEE domain-containing protein [Clostridium sp.]MCE5222000.1 HXXEE domain-containing protein [Clostridium sp.]
MFFPQSLISKYLFFGFVGAMIVNIIFPHLVASIVLKKYCPGLITGVLLIVPFNSLIIIFSVNNGIINLSEIIISTIVVAILLLTLIPRLEKISTSLIDYE